MVIKKCLTFFFFKLGFVSESTILDRKNTSAFNQLCKFPFVKKWELIYRASRDGFDANDFHSKCDGINNTLTIIKSEHGYIFGGFTEKFFGSGSVSDPNAIIFSLINKENNPFKVKCSNRYGRYALWSNKSEGPVFGSYNDFCIKSNSNVNRDSFSSFGSVNCSYKHDDYQGTERARAILAGSENFKTLEIEVFAGKN